jgi:hypothetical protein
MNTVTTVRTFAPEQWGQVDRFVNLYGKTFPDFKRTEHIAVSGVINHLRKAIILRDLAVKLRPNLDLDLMQLEKKGYSPALNSSEFSAVIEGVFTEMYSSLDCTRKVVVAIHRNARGMPTDSTRKLFRKIQNGELDGVLHVALVAAFKNAAWYENFRKMRDELTHGDVGTCHLDKTTGKVSYMHRGLGNQARALVIEDVFERVESNLDDVNLFLGRVFQYLNTLLSAEPVFQMCGIFSGRVYTREVNPSEPVNFDSGMCTSYQWFDLEGNPACPFSPTCGAYKRAKEMKPPVQ